MEQHTLAGPDDLEAVAALLARCGLPHVDIGPHLAHFTVAREDGRIVGVIGVEVHGRDGLMRSLAVAPEHRGRGVARRLYATLLSRARGLGITRLYLLTATAQSWFRLLGFRSVLRDEVPDGIRGTEQYRTLCPSTAACMVRPIVAYEHG
ncbi:MAG: arsenic resistance N-acetyltransferase ArsN2 [Anaeromyxobacteraceae bacterium]